MLGSIIFILCKHDVQFLLSVATFSMSLAKRFSKWSKLWRVLGQILKVDKEWLIRNTALKMIVLNIFNSNKNAGTETASKEYDEGGN